jgi:hypothetical protein
VGNAFLPTFYRLFRWAKKPAHPTWLEPQKKEAMMRDDWAEVSRLAKSQSVHPSTSSGRTD